jgi:hypothetical protein
MQKLLNKIFTITLIISFSITSVANENSIIPIEKLVCYGQGTNQALSPSGDYYAAMVPLDQNVCDIKDETDQEAVKADRVLVVTDLKTMTPKVISGTTAGSAVSNFAWLNDETLLVYRDARSSLDSYSLYTINRDGTNTKLLIAAKAFERKAGFQYPRYLASYPKFPNKIMITLNRNSNVSQFRDLYWLDINTKQTELVARVPSIKNEAVSNWLLDWDGNAKGFSTFTIEGPDMGLVRSFYKYNQDGSYKKIASCRHQDACFSPISFDIDNKTILGVGQAVKKRWIDY